MPPAQGDAGAELGPVLEPAWWPTYTSLRFLLDPEGSSGLPPNLLLWALLPDLAAQSSEEAGLPPGEECCAHRLSHTRRHMHTHMHVCTCTHTCAHTRTHTQCALGSHRRLGV